MCEVDPAGTQAPVV